MTSKEAKEQYPEAYKSGYESGYESGIERRVENAYVEGVRTSIRCSQTQGIEAAECAIVHHLYENGTCTVDEIMTILDIDRKTFMKRLKEKVW